MGAIHTKHKSLFFYLEQKEKAQSVLKTCLDNLKQSEESRLTLAYLYISIHGIESQEDAQHWIDILSSIEGHFPDVLPYGWHDKMAMYRPKKKVDQVWLHWRSEDVALCRIAPTKNRRKAKAAKMPEGRELRRIMDYIRLIVVHMVFHHGMDYLDACKNLFVATRQAVIMLKDIAKQYKMPFFEVVLPILKRLEQSEGIISMWQYEFTGS